MKKNVKSLFKVYLKKLFLIILFLYINTSGSYPENKEQIEKKEEDVDESLIYINSIRDRSKLNLINETKRFINKMAPNSELDGEKLVKECLKYNFNIKFALAQGLLESHYGTKGSARKTNSVWNVGAYDNGALMSWYKDPNESINPYIELVCNRYLMKSDSIDDNDKDFIDLLKDKGYINDIGKRYASAKKYEEKLRKLMIKVDMETSISLYQEIINLNDSSILAYFAPTPNQEFSLFAMD